MEETQDCKLEATTVAEVIRLNYGEVNTLQHIQEELIDMPLDLIKPVPVFELENQSLTWDDYDCYQFKSSLDLRDSLLDVKECYLQIEEYGSDQLLETTENQHEYLTKMDDSTPRVCVLKNFKTRKKSGIEISKINGSGALTLTLLPSAAKKKDYNLLFYPINSREPNESLFTCGGRDEEWSR